MIPFHELLFSILQPFPLEVLGSALRIEELGRCRGRRERKREREERGRGRRRRGREERRGEGE